MKKLMIFMLIGCLALLVSGSIFASAGPAYVHEIEGQLIDDTATQASVGNTATIKAYVTPYAKVTFGAQMDKTSEGFVASDLSKGLIFSGAAHETKQGRIQYTLETNCDVNVDGFGYAFTGNTYGDILETAFQLCPRNDNDEANPGYGAYDWRTISTAGAYVWAPEGFDQKFTPNNPYTYNINFKASTGEISDQRAGFYTAKYIVTVWAPQSLN